MEKYIEQIPDIEGWIVKIPQMEKEIGLDKKDRLILQALLENSRTTLITLSKIAHLSKNSIVNRMKNYEKIGLTKGFSTFIALHKLGLECYQIGIKTKMTLSQKERFIEHIKKIRFINQIIVLTSSHWDFSIRVYSKNSKHFDRIITEINAFPNIIHIDIIPVEKWSFSPARYISKELNLNMYVNKEDFSFQKIFSRRKNGNDTVSVDKKDLEILDILSHNARISLVGISAKIKLSPDAVKYRIKNLIYRGVIENFFVNLNPFMLGFNAYFFTFEIFNREEIDNIIRYLTNHPRCTGVLITKSNWNIIGAILIKNTKELKEFEEQFFAKFEKYVHNYEFIQILEQPYYRLFMKEVINLNS